MTPTGKLWRGLAVVFVLSFAVLGWLGREIYLAAPPIPTAVVTADYQAAASVTHGLWYARSPAIVHSPVMEALVWLRVPGDIVFAVGGTLLALYAAKLLRRPASPSLAQDRGVQTA